MPAIACLHRLWQTLPVAQNLPVLLVVTLLLNVPFVPKKSKVRILAVPMFGNDLPVGL